jgi:hypothetical protein
MPTEVSLRSSISSAIISLFCGRCAALDIRHTNRTKPARQNAVSGLFPHVALVFASSSFPVLLDVEGPLELQMGVVVIVDEFGDGLIVAAAEHAGGGGFGLD